MTAQLTFASADSVAGRAHGGWGVLERSPGLSPEEERIMIERVSVAIPTTVSTFPTPAEIAARPVRLRILPQSLGTVTVTRSVEAGPDHTNRPGNVFTHAILAEPALETRLIDLSRSESWLSPFGAQEVGSARLPAAFTGPRDGGGLAAGWFVDDGLAVAPAVPWVVDVTIQAIAQRQPVCLLVEDSDEALAWMSVICWLLGPDEAARLSCSTLEDSADRAGELGLDLVCAIRGTVGDWPGWVVVDPRWEVDESLAEASGNWSLPNGSVWPRQWWSDVAPEMIWAEREVVVAALRHRDRLADELVKHHGCEAPVASEAALRAAILLQPGLVPVDRDGAVRDLIEVLPRSARRSSPFCELAGEEALGAIELGPTPVSRQQPSSNEGGAGLQAIDGVVTTPGQFVGATGVSDWSISTMPAYPTAESAARAAGWLAADGVTRSWLIDQGRWPSVLRRNDPDAGSAVLHLLAAERRLDIDPGLLVESVYDWDVEHYEAVVTALLQIVVRRWVYTQETIQLVGAGWGRLVKAVGRMGPDELLYLGIVVHPLNRWVEGDRDSTRAAEAIHEQALRGPNLDLWGMVDGSGRSLAASVSRVLNGMGAPATSTGPSPRNDGSM